MVTAIVLAGGLGTRLLASVPHLPKALAPIRGIPFLKLLLNQLEASNIVKEIILALGHKAEAIRTFIDTYHSPIPIKLSVEPTPLGTGGALIQALPLASSSPLLVLNGDTYFDLPFASFLNFHKTRKADITLACREVSDTSRYGSIEITPSLRIASVSEKAPISQSGWINGGIYLIETHLLTPFPQGQYSIEKDFFPQFVKKWCYAFPHDGNFIDIGTPNSYNEAQEILKRWTRT